MILLSSPSKELSLQVKSVYDAWVKQKNRKSDVSCSQFLKRTLKLQKGRRFGLDMVSGYMVGCKSLHPLSHGFVNGEAVTFFNL